MAELVKLADIGMPDPYVRGELDKERVNLMLEAARGKVETGSTPANAFAATFPAVLIMRLAAPGKTGAKDSERVIHYRLLDGVKRHFVAHGLSLSEIPAEITEPLDPGESFIRQYVANKDTGESFSREVRNRAIRTMNGGYKMSNAVIAARIGLSEAQVSRILRGEDVPAPERKARKSSAAKRGHARRKAGKTHKVECPKCGHSFKVK